MPKLDIPSIDGTVQVVMSLTTLEAILEEFPRMTTFPIPAEEGDIPTYGFTLKDMSSSI